MDFCLSFICPAQFCELLPGDLGGSALFLQNLVNHALTYLRWTAVVMTAELEFLLIEYTYSVHISIRCAMPRGALPSDFENFKLETEAVVSQAMLQCFWKVLSSEC